MLRELLRRKRAFSSLPLLPFPLLTFSVYSGSSNKQAKRAARAAAYDSDASSDDEDDSPLPAGLNMDRPEPEAIEGQIDATKEELEASDMGSDDEDDGLQKGQLEDLRAVEKRMRTAARLLANWKELGDQAGMFVLLSFSFRPSKLGGLTFSPSQVSLRPCRAAYCRYLPVPRLLRFPC